MLVAYARTVIAQHTEVLRKCLVVSYTNPCLAIRPQVFTVVEAKTADIPKASNLLPPVGGTMCLGSILNNSKTMRMCKLQHRLHFDWMAIEMNGDNSTSAGS